MSRIGFVIDDVTKDCVNVPDGVEKVFQIYAYDSGHIAQNYGDSYELLLCRTWCHAPGVDDSAQIEAIDDYALKVSYDSNPVFDRWVYKVRELPVIERGKTPTGPCRTKLYKVPRKRECGESRKDYHTACLDWALMLDAENPVVC